MTDPNYVPFGDVARERLGMQCQYARHYLLMFEINRGIRWQGKIEEYHFLTIHRDDVEKFVERALAWRRCAARCRADWSRRPRPR